MDLGGFPTGFCGLSPIHLSRTVNWYFDTSSWGRKATPVVPALHFGSSLKHYCLRMRGDGVTLGFDSCAILQWIWGSWSRFRFSFLGSSLGHRLVEIPLCNRGSTLARFSECDLLRNACVCCGLYYPRLPELRGINDVNNENFNKIIAPHFVIHINW